MNPSILKGIIQLSPLWSLSLIAFIPLIAKMLNNNKELRAEVVSSIYGLAIFISAFLFFFIGFNDKEVLSLRFDYHGSGACTLAALASLISLALFHVSPWIDKKQFTEILFFFCQGILGLYVFCLAQNLLTAFVGLETASLIIYINLAMSRKDVFCLESAIKYFVLSAFSGAVFLYGLSFIFGATGTLELDKFFLQEAGINFYNRFFFLGFALVFSALFFKIALFPFQFWLADVYQGALTPMTAFMAMAVKSSIVLFMGKIFALPFFEKGSHGFVFLSGLAAASVLTVLFGNIMALRQTKLKRLVAFSSLAHSGYLMMALFGILNLSTSEKDFSVIFYYLLAYIFLTGGLLICIQSLEKQTSQPELTNLLSLFKNNPLFASGLSFFLLGLAGIPPSFGFLAKLGLFQPLILSNNWWIVFWAFTGSAIGLYYYMKPITLMLNAKETRPSLEWPWLSKFLVLVLSLAGLFGGWFFGIFFH